MPVISTIEARCKDCYRCLRSCPVKAIRFVGGSSKSELRAKVMGERCVLCGTCLLVCPQKAKKVRPDVDKVKDLIRNGREVIASLAPSFAGAFVSERHGRVVSALRKLGFSRVEETAYAAGPVAEEHACTAGDVPPPSITSSCPVIVNLIEMYYPGVMPHLAPVVSPMVGHARYLKAAHPGSAVVFVGPCVAKKEEAEPSGEVDAALTFAELADWLRQEHVDVSSLDESSFDGPAPDVSRLFPLDGGLLKTAALPTDMLSEEYRVVTGLDNCMQFLQEVRSGGDSVKRMKMVEMLACAGGCISGPGLVTCEGVEPDSNSRRRAVLQYYHARSGAGAVAGENSESDVRPEIDLRRGYSDRRPDTLAPDEVTIRGILAQTGKMGPDDELNCGACGYGSCREKAVAVFHGFADIQMCMPYMRERAESMSNVIISTTPNGIIVVNPRLDVVEVNRAAEAMFGCSAQKVVGKPLSTIIDPSNFEKALETKRLLRVRVGYPEYSLNTDQSIFYVDKENVVIGIFVDRTEEAKRRSEEQKTRQSVVSRAQEVIDKQMKVAQEIAGLLGETTAETKVLLTRLIELMQKE
ncbi:MAG: PAS domain-containing protein [Firmicutes bacterium]|nr:PAS domain-containing protein [Bacillota bacterium]